MCGKLKKDFPVYESFWEKGYCQHKLYCDGQLILKVNLMPEGFALLVSHKKSARMFAEWVRDEIGELAKELALMRSGRR